MLQHSITFVEQEVFADVAHRTVEFRNTVMTIRALTKSIEAEDSSTPQYTYPLTTIY